MTTVLVTGSSGFLGKNLCYQLAQEHDVVVLRFDRGDTVETLRQRVAEADFIFHFAATMRPANVAEFDVINRDLTATIVDEIKTSGKAIPLLLTSSIQAELDNPYGKSKKAAEELVADWSKSTGISAYIYRLPNIFGKWARPNYSSVVATFCHNIARGQGIAINEPARELTLAYVDDVVAAFLDALRGKAKPAAGGFYTVDPTFAVTVQQLADKIKTFRDDRECGKEPNLADPFDARLYATYLSYLPEVTPPKSKAGQ